MRRTYAPALAVSVLLHLGLFALLLFSWESQTIQTGDNAVAVTLVSSLRTAPEPAPTPQPQETAPPPEPQPQPAPPQPAPPPAPKPAAKAATPPKPQKPAQSFDLGALAQSLSKSHASQSKAAPGPVSHKTAASIAGPLAAPVGANDLAGMADKVRELWQIDCDLPGAKNVVADVRFTIGSDGKLTSGPYIVKQTGGTDTIDPAQGAIHAIKAGQPYSLFEVPAKARNQSITMRFRACQ